MEASSSEIGVNAIFASAAAFLQVLTYGSTVVLSGDTNNWLVVMLDDRLMPGGKLLLPVERRFQGPKRKSELVGQPKARQLSCLFQLRDCPKHLAAGEDKAECPGV